MSAWKRLGLALLSLLALILPFGASGGLTPLAISATLVINEIDYDQPATDTAEFIELKNLSAGSINLDNYTLELVNGTGGGATVYDTIDLPNVDLGTGDHYVVCGDAANVANCDLDVLPDSNLIQNGAPDAAGLRLNGLLVDAVSYEGDTGAPYTEGSGAGLQDDSSQAHVGISRCPDGSDTDVNNVDFSLQSITPGAENACGPPAPDIVINELDADTSGIDTLELVELYDGGTGDTALDGLVVVFYNGSLDTSYAAFDLDGFSTDADGYFLLGNSGVTPTPDIVFGDGTLQNGADAVALYTGDAADFPDGTDVTTANLIDAIVYDTDDPDDAELLVLLSPGQPQVNEDGAGDKDNHSNQRCPNGSGGARNTDTYLQNAPTPGTDNDCVTVTLTIMDIQGAAHLSPYRGGLVNDVPGIVTVLRSDGFYMQDAQGDGHIATSDGILVYTGSSPSVGVGDSLLVTGAVSEVYPGGYGARDLATTQITNPTIEVVSSGNALPSATVIGSGGRIPPSQVIDDDATGDVETTGTFDPETDGIDFYESLEGMLVQVNDALVVGSNGQGEITVVGDGGAHAGTFTSRGGLLVQTDDFNPERIIIDDAIVADEPTVSVGDGFTDVITGVMDYSSGNFKLLNSLPLPAVAPGGLVSETTVLTGTFDKLTVASMNVENLDPGDDPSKFTGLADEIVNHLMSPDIIALQEVQDNSGAVDDGVVDASETYTTLISAIQTAGGPTYGFREIPPLDGQDGGQPGGNIRVGFLWRADRVTFVDRPGGDATTATQVVTGSTGVELSISPGRIDPTNAAFDDSRKPLAGEFVFNDQKLFVIGNHFNWQGDDDPLFGRVQPPVLHSEVRRSQQAQVVNDFVDSILALDPTANVIVLGDLNDFPFSTPVSVLAGDVLTNLVDMLPTEEQYTYIYDGNSVVLDHILVSSHLSEGDVKFDVVHVNAEFSPDVRPTDHDPVVGRFTLVHRVFLPVIFRP